MNSSYNSSMSSNSSIGDTTINLKSKLMSIIRKSNTIFVGEYLERRLVKNHPSAIYKYVIYINTNVYIYKYNCLYNKNLISEI